MTQEIIDSKIKALNEKIKDIENRPTEVYSRIVGYYRSVKNWNNGKSAEYKVRKAFMEPETLPCQPPIVNPVEKAEAPAVIIDNQADLFSLQGDEESQADKSQIEKDAPVSYLFFFRETCPNCPPMKEFLSTQEWKGTHINVDKEEGLNAAVESSVFTAPTVILFDSKGTELFRADNVAAMKEFVQSENRTLSAV